MTAERLRIALVRARYNPFGGAERFAARALGALSNGAADVTVIARAWGGGGLSESRMHWVRCDPFYLGSLWRDWSFARAARRLLARQSFDLVQSHERIPGLDIYRAGDGVHAVWLERRRVLATRAERLGLWLNPHHHFLVATERVLFEHPALRAVICNSSMVRDEIATRFKVDPAKLHLIHNGVDLKRFHPRLDERHRVATRTRLQIPARATTFLLVGSGFERKGVRILLEAFAVLQGDAHLIIVGGDKRLARYKERAERLGVAQRVHFVGEESDTRPFYGASDVFVLPSLYDPFPNAALEALASGLAVITSNASGARDVIREGQNGWVVPAGNASALSGCMAEAMRRLSEPGGAQVLRATARQSVEGFGIESLAAMLLDLYRRLLAPP